MSDAAGDDRLARFLSALEKMPPYVGLTFRGLAAGAPAPTTGVLAGLAPSSRDPRVATENLTTPGVLVLMSRTGRDLTVLSQRPHEVEVVLLPGTLWQVHRQVTFGGVPAFILEELDLEGRGGKPESWPDTLDGVVEHAGQVWATLTARGPVEAPTPGKFAGSWPVAGAVPGPA